MVPRHTVPAGQCAIENVAQIAQRAGDVTNVSLALRASAVAKITSPVCSRPHRFVRPATRAPTRIACPRRSLVLAAWCRSRQAVALVRRAPRSMRAAPLACRSRLKLVPSAIPEPIQTVPGKYSQRLAPRAKRSRCKPHRQCAQAAAPSANIRTAALAAHIFRVASASVCKPKRLTLRRSRIRRRSRTTSRSKSIQPRHVPTNRSSSFGKAARAISVAEL